MQTRNRIENPIATVDARSPEQFYFGSSRRHALKELWFGLSIGEIGLLTGRVGLGKTFLCREVLRRLPAAVRSVYVVAPKTEQTLMDNIFQSVAIIRQLDRSLDPGEPLAKSCSHLAIVIDDAQRLGVATIQRLAEWRNREKNNGRSVGLLLVGPPALAETLSAEELQPIAAQITTRCELSVFLRNETEAYIAHWQRQRTTASSVNFSESANKIVHIATGGVPKRINRLCLEAIDAAQQRHQPSVTVLDAVRAAWHASNRGEHPHDVAEGVNAAHEDSPRIEVSAYSYPRTVRLADLGRP